MHNFKKGKPVWDTWDEIAQYKLIYGLVSGIGVWALAGAVVLVQMAEGHWDWGVRGAVGVLVLGIPGLMWITLRWLEDAISAFRAVAALLRLLRLRRCKLEGLQSRRADLHQRIMQLAVHTLGLPPDPEQYFVDHDVDDGNAGLHSSGSQKQILGRVRSSWESGTRYFSVRRRRKRDWNETLRLYDQTEYPDEGDHTDVSI